MKTSWKPLVKLAILLALAAMIFPLAGSAMANYPPCAFACADTPQNICFRTKCTCDALGGLPTVCTSCLDNNCVCGSDW